MSGLTNAQRVKRWQDDRIALEQSIVDTVRDTGPMCAREVSEALDLTKATATQLLRKLARLGLLTSDLEQATDYYPQMRWYRCPS